MSAPQFVISGTARREQKKRLGELKRLIKMFWYYEDIDRVYGGGMDDEKCHKLLTLKKKEVEALEKKLAIRL